MSALPPEADMLIVGINVCYVPISDMAQRYQGAMPPGVRHIGQAMWLSLASLPDITTTRAIQLEIPPRCAL